GRAALGSSGQGPDRDDRERAQMRPFPGPGLLERGEAAVTIGGRTVSTVGENRVVGERGPLEGRTRAASVTATTHMTTRAISKERLLGLARAERRGRIRDVRRDRPALHG